MQRLRHGAASDHLEHQSPDRALPGVRLRHHNRCGPPDTGRDQGRPGIHGRGARTGWSRNWGIFDFSKGRARLRRIFPDVTLAEMEEATGFDLEIAPDLAEVDPPDRSQIDLVRTLDPLGIRQNEFRPGELQRTFRL